MDAAFLDEYDVLKPALIQQAGQLQWPLVTLCTGSASAMLRRESTSSGFELWRKLYNRCHIPSQATAVGRLTKILEPSCMERGKCQDAFAAWEDELLKYEKETDSRLSDDVKIAVLMNKTRGQLQEHLRLNAA